MGLNSNETFKKISGNLKIITIINSCFSNYTVNIFFHLTFLFFN